MSDTYFTPRAIAARELDSAIAKFVAIKSNRKATNAQWDRAEAKVAAAKVKYDMTDSECITDRTDIAQPAEPVTGRSQSKRIQFNRHDKDYEMFLGGRSVGSRATHKAAEAALDALAYEAARRSE